MVTGPHEKYLKRSLQELKRLSDTAVVVGNNTDKETEDLIRGFGFDFYRDDREWGLHQPKIKTDLLKYVGKYDPDWVIAIDSDEVFPPEFDRKEAERLANTDEIAYQFLVVNLYNDSEHFYHGEGIQRFWNVRFYKYMPEHGLEFLKRNVHCGLAPPICYQYAWHAPYYLEHYGLMLKKDRLRKADRYDRYDPNAKCMSRAYYDDLVADHDPIPFNRQKLLNQLSEELKSLNKTRKRPTLTQAITMEYVVVKRLKDGKNITIPKKNLEDTLLQGFELVEKKEVATPKVEPKTPQEPTQEVSGNVCDECSKEYKTPSSLKAHKTRMHK